MTLRKVELVDYLTSDPAVAAVLGSRIYPGFAPQGAPLPLLVYRRVSSEHQEHLGGRSALVRTDYVLELVAASNASRDEARQAVVDALERAEDQAGETFQRIKVLDEFEAYAEQESGQEGRYLLSLDVELWHTVDTG